MEEPRKVVVQFQINNEYGCSQEEGETVQKILNLLWGKSVDPNKGSELFTRALRVLATTASANYKIKFDLDEGKFLKENLDFKDEVQ